MRKSVVFFLLFLASQIMSVHPSWAANILINDSFKDKTQIDIKETTAEIDTVKGWVTLSQKNLANSLILYETNHNITLINNDSIETYEFNGTGMAKNIQMSINGGLIEPVSISSGTYGEYLVLDRGSKTAAWYHYDGIGMVKNGNVCLGNLKDPQATVALNSYELAILDQKQINWYNFDGAGLLQNNMLTVNTGRATNISLAANRYNTTVLDKNNGRIDHYFFNGSTMGLDNKKTFTLPTSCVNPKSICQSGINNSTLLVAVDEEIKAYNFDGSKMVENPYLSKKELNAVFAVASKPGSNDYAVLHNNDEERLVVSYYTYTENGMIEIPSIRIEGLGKVPYANNQHLRGKAVFVPEGVSRLKLCAETELPPGTSIEWEVTTDGNEWQKVTNGGPGISFSFPGTSPNYRSVLCTENPLVSPKILNVQLIDDSLAVTDFRITHVIGPHIPNNPPLPTNERVWIWAGHNVTFQVDTVGNAEELGAEIRVGNNAVIRLNSNEGSLAPSLPVTSYSNTWTGVFHTAADVPIGTSLDIVLTAFKKGELFITELEKFAEVYGSALENHPIHLTK